MSALRQAKARVSEAPPGASSAQVAGLLANARQRKQDSRKRLLTAGLAIFCDRGYIGVAVDEIAAAAGVSRITFYRHFGSKADLAFELYKQAAAVAMPRYLRIGHVQFCQRAVVAEWISELFAADRANRRLLRTFLQATLDETDFTRRAQGFIGDLIEELGKCIPAFAVRPDRPLERRRWLQAWLLLFEILDQSNHSALESGVATDPLVIDILTDRFVAFVTSSK